MERTHIKYLILCLCLTLGFSAYAETESKDLFFDSNGVQIHYADVGEGEPIILIHGFTASYQTNWGMPGIISALAEDYRVIALDNRGHGKSGKPHDPAQYGDEMVEDIVRLMDHLGLRKAHVAGYSMGGFITTNLLTKHPDRVITAITGGAGWTEEGSPVDNTLTELATSLEQGKGFGPLIRALTPAGRPAPTEEQIAMFNSLLGASNDQKALAAVIRGMGTMTITEAQLRANKIPTLAIIGEIDPLKEGVDSMAKVMANLEVVVIDGADHMQAFGRPEFKAAMKDFLAKHRQGEGVNLEAAGATN